MRQSDSFGRLLKPAAGMVFQIFGLDLDLLLLLRGNTASLEGIDYVPLIAVLVLPTTNLRSKAIPLFPRWRSETSNANSASI
jgi:hypothetical protein